MRSLRRPASAVVAAALACAVAAPTAAAKDGVGHRAHPPRHRKLPQVAAPTTEPVAARPPIDDLYRRRGTGIGGAVFGLGGQGGLSIAGTCADLRSVEPRSCGHGYGVYGNGLGYGFGF